MTNKEKGVRGASEFIVEKGTQGFTFGKKENKMGIRASATTELIFQDCRVHKDNLLGREGLGFIIAVKTFVTVKNTKFTNFHLYWMKVLNPRHGL